jgi:carbonic anhydrase/acetyltransferase-like protein (isoleucine patch superfamily)
MSEPWKLSHLQACTQNGTKKGKKKKKKKKKKNCTFPMSCGASCPAGAEAPVAATPAAMGEASTLMQRQKISKKKKKKKSVMKSVLLAGSESEASIVLQHVRADQSLAGVKVLFWKLSGEASDVSSLDASVERVAASGAIEGVAASSLSVYVCAATSRERRAVVSRVNERFADAAFPSLVHRTAVVAPSAKIGQGAVIGALAVVDADAVLHNFVRVGASAVVEAGAVVGDYATLGAASVVGARAALDADITLDANASIRSGVKVASNTHLASQSSLEENVVVPGRDGVSWSGVPAKLAVAAATISSNPASRVRWCYRKPFSSSRFLQYLGPSIAAGHVTNDGPLQLVTASKLKSLVRTTLEVQLCANGTAALHALVSAFNIRDKKEYRWATQAFTFPCSIQGPLIDSIVLDHDAELLGPSMAQLEARKEEFDGVIVTNVFGLQTDVLAYERWCRKNKKLIVFDNAATPVGFAADGRCIHDIGDGSIISLHETKPFGRGEGGVVLMTKGKR